MRLEQNLFMAINFPTRYVIRNFVEISSESSIDMSQETYEDFITFDDDITKLIKGMYIYLHRCSDSISQGLQPFSSEKLAMPEVVSWKFLEIS